VNISLNYNPLNVSGETQACILTKSQPFYQLPSAVTDLDRVPKIPDQVLVIWLTVSRVCTAVYSMR